MPPLLAEEISALDSQLEAIKEHEKNWSPQALKRRRSELTTQLVERTAETERTKAEVGKALADDTAELERRYLVALDAMESYLDAIDAVRELRPAYDELHRRARALGLDLPPRAEPVAVRAQSDYPTKLLLQRAERAKLTW